MNPFQVLGLQPGVTREAAKARYRELVKQHHPDTGGDAEQFKRIQAAWEMLTGQRPRPVYRPQSPRRRPGVVITIVFGSHQATIHTSSTTGSL